MYGSNDDGVWWIAGLGRVTEVLVVSQTRSVT